MNAIATTAAQNAALTTLASTTLTAQETTMNAITHTTYGSADVLSLVELDRPAPSASQVLIRVVSSALTVGDRRMRAADFPGIGWLPGRLMAGLFSPRNAILGMAYAGEVIEVGADVEGFAPGDRVFGSADHSAHAEFLVADASSAIVPMPDSLSFEQAAALPYGAATALTFLRDIAKVQPGERVLINGATGGVGYFAVQLAKHYGAHVTAVGSRDLDWARALGADEVVNYRDADFRDNGARYDVIFDTFGNLTFGSCKNSLTDAGRFVTASLSARILKDVLVTSMVGTQRAHFGMALPDAALLADLGELAVAGAIVPETAARYPLAESADAHRFLEGGRPRGTVMIAVGEPSEVTSASLAA